MSVRMTAELEGLRRQEIRRAAWWCFLHFGYGKTTLEDIAKRSGISRPLLYRLFRNKEEIFAAVLEDGFAERFARAEPIVRGEGSKAGRLLRGLEILLLEPWAEVAAAPMALEFFEACTAITPEVEASHRKRMTKLVQSVLGAREFAEVFLLALDGLQDGMPSVAVLRRRILVLIERFVA